MKFLSSRRISRLFAAIAKFSRVCSSDRNMVVTAHPDTAVSAIASAIGEPARARMLYCLMDGHARTSTGACRRGWRHSLHLHRLKFVPRTPDNLRKARTCYDHMTGAVGVALPDRFHALCWLALASAHDATHVYDVTPLGQQAFASLGIDLHAAKSLRPRFACPCLDWSERRIHLGGARGAALLKLTLKVGDAGTRQSRAERHKCRSSRTAHPVWLGIPTSRRRSTDKKISLL